MKVDDLGLHPILENLSSLLRGKDHWFIGEDLQEPPIFKGKKT